LAIDSSTWAWFVTNRQRWWSSAEVDLIESRNRLGDGRFERLQEQGEQLRDRNRRQSWRPNLPLAVDLVAVATADARLGQVAGSFEVVDDLGRRSFRDSDGFGDVSQARVRIGGDVGEDPTVVGEQAPAGSLISGT
jgi:hypothetical protein